MKQKLYTFLVLKKQTHTLILKNLLKNFSNACLLKTGLRFYSSLSSIEVIGLQNNSSLELLHKPCLLGLLPVLRGYLLRKKQPTSKDSKGMLSNPSNFVIHSRCVLELLPVRSKDSKPLLRTARASNCEATSKKQATPSKGLLLFYPLLGSLNNSVAWLVEGPIEKHQSVRSNTLGCSRVASPSLCLLFFGIARVASCFLCEARTANNPYKQAQGSNAKGQNPLPKQLTLIAVLASHSKQEIGFGFAQATTSPELHPSCLTNTKNNSSKAKHKRCLFKVSAFGAKSNPLYGRGCNARPSIVASCAKVASCEANNPHKQEQQGLDRAASLPLVLLRKPKIFLRMEAEDKKNTLVSHAPNKKRKKQETRKLVGTQQLIQKWNREILYWSYFYKLIYFLTISAKEHKHKACEARWLFFLSSAPMRRKILGLRSKTKGEEAASLPISCFLYEARTAKKVSCLFASQEATLTQSKMRCFGLVREFASPKVMQLAQPKVIASVRFITRVANPKHISTKQATPNKMTFDELSSQAHFPYLLGLLLRVSNPSITLSDRRMALLAQSKVSPYNEANPKQMIEGLRNSPSKGESRANETQTSNRLSTKDKLFLYTLKCIKRFLKIIKIQKKRQFVQKQTLLKKEFLFLNLFTKMNYYGNSLFWRWVKRRHNKKSKSWIFKKYWVFINNKPFFYIFF